MTTPPAVRSYIEATPAIAAGEKTPRDFLEACLASIDAREKDVLAFVCLNIEAARARADESTARWRAGRPLSPIDGMPVGIKDVIETEDMPTGMGSPLFTGWRSGRDAASVKALRQAGAVIVGKTVTTEFAASEPGPTRNPHDLTRTPGGSSSGSAAGSASGFFTAGLGTQVVGSILRPASFCGVVGFKPSLGGVNRGGSHDFMSQSCQGALGASLGDVWRTLIEIVARVGGDPGYPGLAGPAAPPAARKPRTLAFLETPGWEKTSDALKQATREALTRLEKSGVEIISRHRSSAVEAVEHGLIEALRITRDVNGYESLWPLNIYRDRDASKVSKALLTRLAECEKMTPDDYRRVLAERVALRALYASLAGRVDAYITLSAIGPAPVGLASTGDPAFATPSSVLGVPALSLPLLTEAGLPVGLQLMGFEQRDADLFATAAAVESLVGTINA